MCPNCLLETLQFGSWAISAVTPTLYLSDGGLTTEGVFPSIFLLKISRKMQVNEGSNAGAHMHKLSRVLNLILLSYPTPSS